MQDQNKKSRRLDIVEEPSDKQELDIAGFDEVETPQADIVSLGSASYTKMLGKIYAWFGEPGVEAALTSLRPPALFSRLRRRSRSMLELRAATIYLDEAGHVYLPRLGPAQSCLRLNRSASELWRRWVSAPVDEGVLKSPERQFLRELLQKGALTDKNEDREGAQRW
jgi:hypothetical protein